MSLRALPLAARLLWGCGGLLAVTPVAATSLQSAELLSGLCCALDLLAVSIGLSASLRPWTQGAPASRAVACCTGYGPCLLSSVTCALIRTSDPPATHCSTRLLCLLVCCVGHTEQQRNTGVSAHSMRRGALSRGLAQLRSIWFASLIVDRALMALLAGRSWRSWPAFRAGASPEWLERRSSRIF